MSRPNPLDRALRDDVPDDHHDADVEALGPLPADRMEEEGRPLGYGGRAVEPPS